MSALERHLRELTERRTDRTLESYETVLPCTRCETLIALFEASTGATTEEEHRWGDPTTFVCVGCLDPDTEG